MLFGVMTTAAFAAEYNLKMGMVPGTISNRQTTEYFANKIKEESNGRIEVALFQMDSWEMTEYAWSTSSGEFDFLILLIRKILQYSFQRLKYMYCLT